jgi:hypothetical protein
MTDVLLLGDIPSTGYLVGTSAERLSGSSRASEETAHLLATMEQRLRSSEAIIALYPAWNADGPKRLLKLARGVLSTDRIAGVPLALPPLALSLVADQIAYLAPYLQPGHLASVAHSLANAISAGAWTRSVTKLEHIDTKMGHHLASYLPHETFVVTATPHGAIHRISGHKVPELGFRPTEPIHLLVTQGDNTWFQEGLQNLLRADAVKAVPQQPLGVKFWGNKRYIEYVAFSGHPAALSQISNATRCWPCRWCGQHVALQECPFCGMAQPREQAVSTPAARVPDVSAGQQGAAPGGQPPRPQAQPQAQPQAPAQPHRAPRGLPAGSGTSPAPAVPQQGGIPERPAAAGQPYQQGYPPMTAPAPQPGAPAPTPRHGAPAPQRAGAPPHGGIPAQHGPQSPRHPAPASAAQASGASPTGQADWSRTPQQAPAPTDQRVASGRRGSDGGGQIGQTGQHPPQFSYSEQSPAAPEQGRSRTPRGRSPLEPAPRSPQSPYPAQARGPQTPEQAAQQLRADAQWNGRNATGSGMTPGGQPNSQGMPGQTSSQYPPAVDTVRGTTSALGPEQSSVQQARNDQNWTGRNSGNPPARPTQPNGQPPDRVSP